MEAPNEPARSNQGRKKTRLWPFLAGLVFLALVAVGSGFLLTPVKRVAVVPVRFTDPPEGLAVAPVEPATVEAELAGPRWRLWRMDPGNVVFFARPEEFHKGLISVPVNGTGMRLPPGVRLVSASPEAVTAMCYETLTREVFVVVETSGEPAPGYTITALSANPDRVLLSGPTKVLDRMDTVKAGPVPVNGANSPVEARVALNLPDEVFRVGVGQPVEVSVQIDTVKALRRLDHVPVQGKNGGARAFEIAPPEISLLLKGPVKALEELDPEADVSVFVDLAGLEPGVYVRRAVIRIPVAAILMDAQPEVFTVRVRQDPLEANHERFH